MDLIAQRRCFKARGRLWMRRPRLRLRFHRACYEFRAAPFYDVHESAVRVSLHFSRLSQDLFTQRG
eukprot:2584592-Alexandrium_andersonii.AAC.1